MTLPFNSIKGIIFFTFYQGFIFSILQTHGAIKASTYWTATNVADGLQALCTCCEMVSRNNNSLLNAFLTLDASPRSSLPSFSSGLSARSLIALSDPLVPLTQILSGQSWTR